MSSTSPARTRCSKRSNPVGSSRRLHGAGWEDEDVALVFEGMDVVPFDARHALLSGRYRPATRSLGLGLGDRACLATATLQRCPALTADRVWTTLDVGAEIVCIR